MEMLGVPTHGGSANAAARGGGGPRRGGQGAPHGRGGGGHGYGRGRGRHQGGGNGGRRGGGGGRHQGSGGGNDRELIVCQICGNAGHPAWKCWHRYSDDEEEDQEKGVNAAYGVDTNWYSDTGATDHITGELDKLTMKEKYNGHDKIQAANGIGMNISHVGHAFVESPSKKFHLHNVLHIPCASKNLVSVHRFTLDNGVFVEFHPWFFYVKDQVTKKILLKGRCIRGLYPLVSSSSSMNKQALSATKPSATRWHDRLGHPSFKVVQNILRKYDLPFF
jgi:hypothetical protein